MIKATFGIVALASAIAGQALAWGDEGHIVTGIIAYDRLTPKAKARVDAILATDTDTLTAPDFASRTTWADKYRTTHRETAAWHFVDTEIEAPDLKSACFGFPTLAPRLSASAGPAEDCVVDKIEEFQAELANPSTPPAEQLLALKFLMHFVGDIHQPLHASDHEDKGGNCIAISPIARVRSNNLHAYWDTGVMSALGGSAPDIAKRLEASITAQDVKTWSTPDVKAWAEGSFGIARTIAYQLPSLPTCAAPGTVTLSSDYQVAAQKAAAVQLQKAGVRMAYMLNQALGR